MMNEAQQDPNFSPKLLKPTLINDQPMPYEQMNQLYSNSSMNTIPVTARRNIPSPNHYYRNQNVQNRYPDQYINPEMNHQNVQYGENYQNNIDNINSTVNMNINYEQNQRVQPIYQGPYGVKFGEENMIRERDMKNYRNDLDYLVKLRRPYGNMTQKEWEEYNRKIDYMNDKYAYGELDKRNFLRGMTKGYEDEINYRKSQMRMQKLQEEDNERKKLESLHQQEALESQKRKDQKHRLLSEQLNELDSFNKRRQYSTIQKEMEGKENLKLFDVENKILSFPTTQYRNRLSDINNKIYGNIQGYNNLLNRPIPENAFRTKNDFDFNKSIAAQRELDRDKNKRNPIGLEERLQDMQNQKELNKLCLQDKKNNQKLYKDYLDNQNQVNQLYKLNQNKDDFSPQLLMPAYYYPNRAVALNKKAKDSLLFSKFPNQYFEKDMNKFFRWDSQYNTLMDYDNSGGYLGDSKLRSNPITCPVNDYYYNKYINKLKKESEVPPNNGRYYNAMENNNQGENKYKIKAAQSSIF